MLQEKENVTGQNATRKRCHRKKRPRIKLYMTTDASDTHKIKKKRIAQNKNTCS